MHHFKIFHNDARKWVNQTLNYIFESYITDTQMSTRYGFLANNYYIGSNFPTQQINKRFLIIYGIENEMNQDEMGSRQQFLLTIQLIDTGIQAEIRDTSDKTTYMFEILKNLLNLAYWSIVNGELLVAQKIAKGLELNYIKQLSSSQTIKQDQTFQKTVNFQVNYHTIRKPLENL